MVGLIVADQYKNISTLSGVFVYYTIYVCMYDMSDVNTRMQKSRMGGLIDYLFVIFSS